MSANDDTTSRLEKLEKTLSELRTHIKNTPDGALDTKFIVQPPWTGRPKESDLARIPRAGYPVPRACSILFPTEGRPFNDLRPSAITRLGKAYPAPQSSSIIEKSQLDTDFIEETKTASIQSTPASLLQIRDKLQAGNDLMARIAIPLLHTVSELRRRIYPELDDNQHSDASSDESRESSDSSSSTQPPEQIGKPSGIDSDGVSQVLHTLGAVESMAFDFLAVNRHQATTIENVARESIGSAIKLPAASKQRVTKYSSDDATLLFGPRVTKAHLEDAQRASSKASLAAFQAIASKGKTATVGSGRQSDSRTTASSNYPFQRRRGRASQPKDRYRGRYPRAQDRAQSRSKSREKSDPPTSIPRPQLQ
jgi:hypothetical protein